MLFICYPRCTTCKKAQKWLDDNLIEYEIRNITMENPTYDELKSWHEKSKLPIKRFFNTSGKLYKDLNIKDRLKELSEDEQIKLLSTDGMLVKRPLLISEEFVFVGFKEDEWELVKNESKGCILQG